MSNKWEDFLKDIVKGENLDLETEYSAFSDILVKISSLIFPPVLMEIEEMLKNQSMANFNDMSEDELDRLMANKMVGRYSGSKASGTARMYFDEPNDLNVVKGESFTDKVGNRYFSTSNVVLSYDQMNLLMEGRYFYADIPIEAEESGEVYNIDKNSLVSVSGDYNHLVKVSNRFPIRGGTNKETNFDLMRKGVASQSIRDFACKWGINTLIRTKFPQVLDVRVIGSGEEGMTRDKLFGIHANGKADVYVKTTTRVQKSRVIPAGTSIIQLSKLPDGNTDLENEAIVTDVPVLSIDHLYIRSASDTSERTGEEIRLVGGYGMGGYGYGVYGQGGVQILNREEGGTPISINVTDQGKAIFTKFSRVVKGVNTNWRETVHRGDRIQRTFDPGQNYTRDFGNMYTIADVVSDNELVLVNRYREATCTQTNYRVQGYLYRSEIPSALHHVMDSDGNSTRDLRYSSKEFSYIRLGREHMMSPIEVVFTTDPLIEEIQAFADEHINKVVGFDVVVKHFVPVYVDFDIIYEGGPSPDRMSVLLRDVIDKDKIYDPELDKIQRLSNWDGDHWVIDISDLIDLFYNSGCTYVHLPPKVSLERHYPGGSKSTEEEVTSYITIDPFHSLIARDITLKQQKIVERK